MSSPQVFWNEVENYGQTLVKWNEHLPSLPEMATRHKQFCQVINAPFAAKAVADPRNITRLQQARNAMAHLWSSLNSRLEFIIAEDLSQTCQTYEDFQKATNSHWLFTSYADMLRCEQELYTSLGMDISKMKICNIGPGAMPQTCLSLRARGADITVVDLYGPACRWCETWFSRFFPQGGWKVIETGGQNIDFSEYDLIIVASMLEGRADVLRKVNETARGYVQVRSTSGIRPKSVLLSQIPEDDIKMLEDAEYVAETKPPLTVGTYSLMYKFNRQLS